MSDRQPSVTALLQNSPVWRLLLISSMHRPTCVRKRMAACRTALGIHGPARAVQWEWLWQGRQGTLFLMDLPECYFPDYVRSPKDIPKCRLLYPTYDDPRWCLRISMFISMMLCYSEAHLKESLLFSWLTEYRREASKCGWVHRAV